MIAVLLTGGRQPHGAQPGPALPGLTGKPRGRRYGHKEGRSVLVAPALSHLPVSRESEQGEGKGSSWKLFSPALRPQQQRAFKAEGLGPSQPFPLSIQPARGCGTTGWTIRGSSQALVLVGKSCLRATPCLKGQRGKGLCAQGVHPL